LVIDAWCRAAGSTPIWKNAPTSPERVPDFGIAAVLELARHPQWVRWRRERRQSRRGKAEYTKVPYCVDGVAHASSTDPSTWSTFEAVVAAHGSEPWGEGGGIGFTFAPDGKTVGTDLDGCRNAYSGAIAAWAREVIASLDTYTEISPSGTGVKLFCHGVWPDTGRKVYPQVAEQPSTKKPAIEVYDRARYFTVTGLHLEGTPETIEYRQDALDALYARFFAPAVAHPRVGPARANGAAGVVEATDELNLPPSAGLSDDELLDLARSAANADKFCRLFDQGDIAGYPSDSEADAALIGLLLFYAASDLEQVDRLFRQSALYRDKWNRADYRVRTIHFAARGRTDFYHHYVAPSVEAEPFASGVEPASSSPQTTIIPFPLDALPSVLRVQVEHNLLHGLPAAFSAGAGLVAAAIAIGARAELVLTASQVQRAVLWVPNIGARGTAKTPSQDLLMRPVRVANMTRALDDEAARQVDGDHTSHVFLCEDLTLEALARLLADEPGVSLDVDELGQLLVVGEYKGRAQTGDITRLLKLWNGQSWSMTRVGSGGKRRNGVVLFIPVAVTSIIGGIQPELHALLGGDANGLRPRWMPHLVSGPPLQTGADTYAETLDEWTTALNRLLNVRGDARAWKPSPRVIARFRHWGRIWRRRASDPTEIASSSAFLLKGEIHLQRIVLVCLELETPMHIARTGDLLVDDIDLVDRAALWVEYCAECWRALGESDSLALSTRDERLDRAVHRLRAWLNEHGGRTSARDIRRLGIAGANTPPKRDAVIQRFAETYPGCVSTTTPEGGGPPTVWVESPDFRSVEGQK